MRTALSAHWQEDCFGDADFALGDDWNASFHHCGGIYSDRIMCPLYVQTIASVLAEIPHAKRWTFHTAVEPQNADRSCGEFFIRDDILYARSGDSIDYDDVFGGKAGPQPSGAPYT